VAEQLAGRNIVLRYLARRLVSMAVTLFFISILGFLLIDLTPGTALQARVDQLRSMGVNLTGEEIHALEQRYGLSDPVQVKYFKWISHAVRGDFGESFTYNTSVGSLIWSRLAFSALLAGFAAIFAWLVAIPIGVYSATNRYTIPDYLITIFQFVGVAVPEFLLALLVMVFAARVLDMDVGGLFSVKYANAPWSGEKFVDLLRHLWIPVVIISAGSTAWLSRVMRANLLDVLNQQYVQVARAKGQTEAIVIWKHAVRNALHPLIMALGGLLPTVISGELIVSMVLNLPTIGPLYFNALLTKDMYLAITFMMMTSILLVLGNLVADLLLAWVDPRVRLE
jgi:peptide/nickel transport system permease protein